jgi:hypothetical protein
MIYRIIDTHLIQKKCVQSLFSNLLSPKYLEFNLVLLQYVRIVEPLIRSLWALEASHATASDVFVFFTACAAALKELFEQDPEATGIPRALANTIVDKFNDRYDELFANDIYFCVFVLDPHRLFLFFYYVTQITQSANICTYQAILLPITFSSRSLQILVLPFPDKALT